MPRPVLAVHRLVQLLLVRLRLVQVLLVPLALVATGCAVGEPRSIGPAGVDGLEIPTPSPDPADFVPTIDNPRLPLVAGSTWVYERTTGSAGRTVAVTVTVAEEPRTIAGVATTAVETVTDRGAEATTRYLAQDRDGNVWSFGGDGWRAGEAGTRAGLVMPATPRVGDGFAQEDAAGVAEGRSEVLDVAASASAPYDSWTDLVEIRETSALAPGAETRRFYASGVGLVRSESADGVTALVSYTR